MRMAISRAERRADRRARVAAALGDEAAEPALDLLELVELAWHDCYGAISPPEDLIDDLLLISQGSLAELVRAALVAVIDFRDTKVVARQLRATT